MIVRHFAWNPRHQDEHCAYSHKKPLFTVDRYAIVT